MNEDAKIILHDDDGNKIELFVIEETRINNINYLLAAENDEDESEAYILKDISDPDDDTAVYTFVEDENEIDYIGRIFSEILDDADIGLE